MLSASVRFFGFLHLDATRFKADFALVRFGGMTEPFSDGSWFSSICLMLVRYGLSEPHTHKGFSAHRKFDGSLKPAACEVVPSRFQVDVSLRSFWEIPLQYPSELGLRAFYSRLI